MSTVKIKGMSCQHCVMAVDKALSGIDGLSQVQVNLEKGEVTFEQTRSVESSVIEETIKKAGYEVVH